ncbi:unnamed protein product [Orchesella dallaii]|uniref:Chitin-binding type-2 domain-containing protein n=1 Tax=Orchesella dallaii TaxID=48710 RepID=A0ABP1R3J2_9HEXA
MTAKPLRVLQVVNSSLWITVLVVRVGCIIEAHPSPNNSHEHKVSHHVFTSSTAAAASSQELDTAASHSIISSPTNSFSAGVISKKPSSTSSLGSRQQISIGDGEAVSIPAKSFMRPTTATTLDSTNSPAVFTASSPSPTTLQLQGQHESGGEHQMPGIGKMENENNGKVQGDDDNDDCSGKPDGYYQNFGSGCTSYYFCAAGYQITYVCPIGSKFNGKRCEDDYNCPTAGHVNDCKGKSNGYYPSRKNPGKYFYCFQQAKVIELQCETGKTFVLDKCSYSAELIIGTGNEERTRTCTSKSNGFYQDLSSNCEKYYYCIGGEKRELTCQSEYIFNGDICVHSSRYQCPGYRKPVERQILSLKKVKPTATDVNKPGNGKEGMKLSITTVKTTQTFPSEIVEKTTITVDSHLFDPNNV